MVRQPQRPNKGLELGQKETRKRERRQKDKEKDAEKEEKLRQKREKKRLKMESKKLKKEAEHKLRKVRNKEVFTHCGAMIVIDGQEFGFVSNRNGVTAYRNLSDPRDIIYKDSTGSYFRSDQPIKAIWATIESELG